MKICVSGAQCVGKSTFINDVVNCYPDLATPVSTYRDAIINAGISDKINRNTNLVSQRLIFNNLRDEIVKNVAPDVIFDRSPMDGVAYSVWSNKFNPKSDIGHSHIHMMKIEANALMRRYDLILHIPVDETIKLTDDNFRDTDKKYRDQMGKIFVKLLHPTFNSKEFNKWGYKVATIEGSRQERLDRFKMLYLTLKGNV